MKYRSKIDVMCQILRVANGGGVTKTKRMYKAFLKLGTNERISDSFD